MFEPDGPLWLKMNDPEGGEGGEGVDDDGGGGDGAPEGGGRSGLSAIEGLEVDPGDQARRRN